MSLLESDPAQGALSGWRYLHGPAMHALVAVPHPPVNSATGKFRAHLGLIFFAGPVFGVEESPRNLHVHVMWI